MTNDRAAIRRLVAEYAQAVDDRRFDDWVALYAPDGVHESAGRVMRGHDEIRTFIEHALPPERLVHINSASVIDVDGDRASGTTDWMTLRITDGGIVINATGRYFDQFVRLGGRWLFRYRRNDVRG